jgi:hypothetical protein
MKLWPATIARPPSTKCRFVASLIIGCRHSERQRLWRGEGAHGPALWPRVGWRTLFLCGDGPSARAPCHAKQHRDDNRVRKGGRRGQVWAAYGGRPSHAEQVSRSRRASTTGTLGGACPPPSSTKRNKGNPTDRRKWERTQKKGSGVGPGKRQLLSPPSTPQSEELHDGHCTRNPLGCER